MRKRISFMVRFGMILTFGLLFGSTNLFAASQYNVCDGWTLVKYSNGVYGLNDDSRGICYDISISSVGKAFRVCVGNWVKNQVSEYAIEATLEAGLKALGVAARYASISASVIVSVFDSSPAY